MSKPAANPFMENEFTRYFDVSKVMEMPKAFQDMKVPGWNLEAFVDAQRKNMQALAAANQMAMEGFQTIMRRQNEIMRQSIKESSSLLNDVLTSGTPEEKVTKQAELAKSVLDRTMINARELAEMAAKTNYEAMEVISNRMGEGLEELRGIVKTNANAASKLPANK